MAGNRAVLTGNLARSSGRPAAAADAAFALLAEAAAELARWHGASLRLTRFRGDGWQCLLAEPGLSLRSALYLLARLKAAGAPLEARIAVAVGPIERPGSTDLSDAAGPAFARSGLAFDRMRRGRRIVLWPEGARPPAPVIFTLADALAQRWTRVQAEVLAQALPPDAATQSEIARRLGTTQQNVAARLDAAGFRALEEAMLALERVLARGGEPAGRA